MKYRIYTCFEWKTKENSVFGIEISFVSNIVHEFSYSVMISGEETIKWIIHVYSAKCIAMNF